MKPVVRLWDNYELNGTSCPLCGYENTQCRPCSNFCNQGYHGETDDPMGLYAKDIETICPECGGTSIEVWCPCCRTNVSGITVAENDCC